MITFFHLFFNIFNKAFILQKAQSRKSAAVGKGYSSISSKTCRAMRSYCFHHHPI